MTSNTVRRFDNSGLFGPSFNDVDLCLSYDITQKNVYGRGIGHNKLDELTTAVRLAEKRLIEETKGKILETAEIVTVRLIEGFYEQVHDGVYSSGNEHRLNVGLTRGIEFDLTWTMQDFLNRSKKFIEEIGIQVSDELTHKLPIGASRNLDHYLRNYLGSKK